MNAVVHDDPTTLDAGVLPLTFVTQRLDARTRRRIGFWLGVVLYGGLSAIAYLHVFPANRHLLFMGAGGDVAQETWFLKWTSFAILHGHNPFYTTFVDYPRGANLGEFKRSAQRWPHRSGRRLTPTGGSVGAWC